MSYIYIYIWLFKFVYRFRIWNRIQPHWGEFTYLFLRTEAVTAYEMYFDPNIRRRGAKWIYPKTLHIGKYSTDIRSKLRPSYQVTDSDFVITVCDAVSSYTWVSLSWNKWFRPTLPSFWLSRDTYKSTDCLLRYDVLTLKVHTSTGSFIFVNVDAGRM